MFPGCLIDDPVEFTVLFFRRFEFEGRGPDLRSEPSAFRIESGVFTVVLRERA